MTLFESVSGYRPWPDADSDAGLGPWPQLDLEPYALPEEVPDELAKPIWACLEPEPADRPHMEELARTLEPLAAALRRKVVLNRLRPRSR